MSKQEKIYEILDEMVITLNEQKRRLAKKVETGQLTNAERHEQLNQLYVTTLNNTAKDIISPPTPYEVEMKRKYYKCATCGAIVSDKERQPHITPVKIAGAVASFCNSTKYEAVVNDKTSTDTMRGRDAA